MKIIFFLISILIHSLIFFKVDMNISNKILKKSNHKISVKLIIGKEKKQQISKLVKKLKEVSTTHEKGNSESTVKSKTNIRNGNKLKPIYPWRSKVLKEEGTVVIGLIILPSGKLEQIKIIKSSGHKRLDNAAIESLKNMIIAKDQIKTAESKKITFHFKLR